MQVDPVAVKHVQECLSAVKKRRLLEEYGVNIDQISRAEGDLTNVRNCVAVARAYVFLIASEEIPADNKGQAAYWVGNSAFFTVSPEDAEVMAGGTRT